MQYRYLTRTALAALALLATPLAQSATFPHTPETRPVPSAGSSEADVLANFGQPARGIVTQQIGQSDVSVWDFGTFRVFIKNGRVLESRRW